MSSNSIRIGAALFEDAQSLGAVVSRSAAQQVEYWARLGQALERSGASAQQLLALLQGQAQVARPTEAQLRAAKRQEQAKDIDDVKSGRIAGDDLIWFSEARAKNAKVHDSPY